MTILLYNSVFLSTKYCNTHSLCQDLNFLVRAHCFFVCLIYFALQFYVSPFSYNPSIYNCIFHAPRLPQKVSNWHSVSCNSTASQTAKNQDCIGFVVLQFPFIRNGSEMQRWKGNGGQHKADFGPGTCMRWSGAHCVTLRLASFVAQAEITAVYSF